MAKKNDYFKTFCKVSKAFGTTFERGKLLSLIVESAIETMDGKAACLFLADAEKDVFNVVAQSGLSENYLHANVIKAKKLVDGLTKAGHLAFADATDDPRLENLEAKKAEGIASILTVPVFARDKVIGVLSLYTAERREFSAEEIEFLRALADQGGMAIEQARLIERIRINTELFLDLASSINSSLDIRQVLSIMTEEVCKTLELKGATIRLLDRETDNLELVASWGLSEAFLNKGPVSATKSAREALRGKTVAIEDAVNDERIQYKKEFAKEGIASLLVVPIQSRKDIIGVLRLYSATPHKFTAGEKLIVQALAHQGALAIQNASMYLRLEQDKKSLEEDIWSHRSWF